MPHPALSIAAETDGPAWNSIGVSKCTSSRRTTGPIPMQSASPGLATTVGPPVAPPGSSACWLARRGLQPRMESTSIPQVMVAASGESCSRREICKGIHQLGESARFAGSGRGAGAYRHTSRHRRRGHVDLFGLPAQCAAGDPG